MRTDQYIGLSLNATSFLEKNAAKVETITTTKNLRTGKSFTVTTTEFEVVEGGSKFKYFSISDFDVATGKLDKYILLDGTELYEYVQLRPWYFGPVFFTALCDVNEVPVQETLWSKEHMEKLLKQSKKQFV